MLEFFKWVLSDFWRFLGMAAFLIIFVQWQPVYIDNTRIFANPKDFQQGQDQEV